MELLNFITWILCTFGILNAWRGEVLAVKGSWCDVKLHCQETGNVFQWAKHTDKTPRSWFKCDRVWYR